MTKHTFKPTHLTVEPMACGGCGHGSFSMGKYHDGLVAMCQKCGSVSTITVTQPRIEIGWDTSEQLGALCTMQPTTL